MYPQPIKKQDILVYKSKFEFPQLETTDLSSNFFHMKPKKRPAANVSRMSIRTWRRKGRKRTDFSHLLDFKLFVKIRYFAAT